MRVGIKFGDTESTRGGGPTLQRAILSALDTVSSPHELVRLEHLQGQKKSHTLLHRAVRRGRRLLRRLANSAPEPDPWELRLRQAELDVLWYVSPGEPPAPLPYIATVWDLEHRRLPIFPEVSTTGWSWQDRESNYSSLLPRATRILTGTNAGKNEIVDFYRVPPDNVRVVPFPVDGRCRTPTVGGDSVQTKCGFEGRFIFYPAQFWPHKNHVNLLFALRRYNDEHSSPLHLILTGSDMGNLEHVMNTVRQLELSAFVHVLGFVSYESLPAIYAQSEAMVFPTFFGPDNIPPLEAFAAGCPVAASCVPGAEEQLGNAAILFNPADPADIARAIACVVDDPDKRSELIGRGLRRVVNLTPENYVRRVFEILEEIEPMRRCWGKSHTST